MLAMEVEKEKEEVALVNLNLCLLRRVVGILHFSLEGS